MTDLSPLQCFGLGFICGVSALYLVRQMFTGELTEDEDQYQGSDLHEGWPR